MPGVGGQMESWYGFFFAKVVKDVGLHKLAFARHVVKAIHTRQGPIAKSRKRTCISSLFLLATTPAGLTL